MKASRRRARDTARLLSLLASFEAPCTTCDDGTVPNTEALAAWDQRMEKLRPEYVPDNPFCGGSVRYIDALSECPPKQVPCPDCRGNSVMLTEAGLAVVRFLGRHGFGGAR